MPGTPTPSHDSRAPFFSVILCTYNRATLLPRALDSLIAQTDAGWELILVDDGSTDNTAEVIRDWIAQHPQAAVVHIHHTNIGLAASRNVGAGAASGEWLTFLDSDDFYAPEHLAARRRVLEQHPAVDFLHGGVTVIGDPYVADKDNPDQLIHLDECLIDATVFIRRAAFLALGGIPLVPYAPANAFHQRVLAAGLTVMKTDQPTYIYDRTTPDSICTIVGQGGVAALEAFRRGEPLADTTGAGSEAG